MHFNRLLLGLEEVLQRHAKAMEQDDDLSVKKPLAELAASYHVQSRAWRLKFDLTWSQLDLPAPEPPINLKHAFCSAQSELKSR